MTQREITLDEAIPEHTCDTEHACGAGSSCDAAGDLPVSIEHISVYPGRLSCKVLLSPRCPTQTNAALIAKLCETYPHLPQHACVNIRGSHFSCVMNETPLPHLLEHLTIEIQVRENMQENATDSAFASTLFTGTSEWLDNTQRCARVDVSFTDDLCALRALHEALEVLNEALRCNDLFA